jgi:aspartate/glutamate racemase
VGIETLAIASLAGSALSAGVGFIGAQQQASAQAASANYQAQVARNNAVIQQQNAARAAQTGRAQAQQQDLKNAATYSQVLAAEGASGIDLSTGSPRQVQSSAQQIGRLDTLNIADRAAQQVRGYQINALSDTAQAQLDTMQAQNAQTAGTISGISSIIGGASSFADKWMRFQTTGVPGFA